MKKKIITSLNDLSGEQVGCLINFIKRNGKNWKNKLLSYWMVAGGNYMVNYPNEYPYLQQIRNQFGPTWLNNLPNSEWDKFIK